jgi:hypothetical protein
VVEQPGILLLIWEDRPLSRGRGFPRIFADELQKSAQIRGSLQPSNLNSRLDERPVAQVRQRLQDLLTRVHHERAVAGDRLAERRA